MGPVRRLRAATGRHPLVAFVVLAYAFSWSLWVPLALTGTRVPDGQGWPSHLPGLLGPGLTAVVVTALADGADGVRALLRRLSPRGVRARWYLLVLGTAGLVALAPLVAAVRGDPLPALADYTTYSGAPAARTAAGTVAVLLYALLLNGFGEELGWRGFLADRLLDPARPDSGRLRAALVVAPVWALWHGPSFAVAEGLNTLGPAGTVAWFVGLVAGSVVLTWLYDASGRSVLVVALWHLAFNLSSATAAGHGAPAAAATTVVMVVAVGLVLRSRRRAAGLTGPGRPGAAAGPARRPGPAEPSAR